MHDFLNRTCRDKIRPCSSGIPCFHGSSVRIVRLSSPGDHHNVLFVPDNIHSDSQQVLEPEIQSELE